MCKHPDLLKRTDLSSGNGFTLMGIVTESQPEVNLRKQAIEQILPSGISRKSEPVSFRNCRRAAGLTTRVATTSTGHTWGSLLQKLEQKKSPAVPKPERFEQSQGHAGERRAFPRHSSDAIILAFNQDEAGLTSAGEATGKKGYAINVSRNGISFAARSEFQPREQLQLRVEETQLNFSLNVSAEVLRCESLDSEFRRVDCKLVTPLTDQQIQLLKEHVPSCFAG